MYIALPSVAQAKILINEIAWMGILGTGGANGEWVELYNTDESQDVTDWILYKKQAEAEIKLSVLSGVIESGGFFVLERSTNTMPDPIPNVSDGKLLSGLVNLPKGEHLVLRDANGVIVDEVDFSLGWPAGDNDNKNTMQLTSRGTWVTGAPSPARSNAEEDAPSPLEKEQDKSSNQSTQKNTLEIKDSLILSVPEKVYAGLYTEYKVSTVLSKKRRNAVFIWNMGDGTVLESKDITNVKHEYRYPGIYTISFVYKDTKTNEVFVSAQKVVSVIPNTISLVSKENQGITISHTENFSIDISGWQIHFGEQVVSLPGFTILAPKGSITFLFERLGGTSAMSVSLYDNVGRRIVSDEKNEPKKESTISVSIPTAKRQVASNAVVPENTQTIFVKSSETKTQTKQQSHTKYIYIGVASIVGIGLLLLLERFIAQKE